MAKKDTVDSAEASEAVPHRVGGADTAKKADAEAAAIDPKQLQLLSSPPDAMVEQILERQAVFGF